MGLLGKQEEANQASVDSKMSGPPPPYEGGPTNMQYPQSQAQVPVHRQFPPVFNIYVQGGWSRHYILGEHQNQPLYHVSTHSGWSGQADMILHNGPSESAPPLATVTLGRWSADMDVELPPAQPGGSTKETVSARGWFSRTHGFSIEVPGPNGMHREEFEWKSSHGEEVGRLGGAWSGWKLTRVNGGEIVAVCANASMSWTKCFQFEFLNSGAAGMLGERFAVMAVITGLGLYERSRRSKNNGVAGASAGAAAA